MEGQKEKRSPNDWGGGSEQVRRPPLKVFEELSKMLNITH